MNDAVLIEDATKVESLGPPTKDWKATLKRAQVALSTGAEIEIEPSLVHPLKGQPRRYLNPASIQRLADSITEVGQIYAGIVRRLPGGVLVLDHEDSSTDRRQAEYELLDGERRWRATAIAGKTFRAKVIEIDDAAARYLVAAIANFNRDDHTTLEVVDSVTKMHDELGIPLKEVAKLVGLSEFWTSRMYSLRRLSDDVRLLMDPVVVTDKRKLLPVNAALHIANLRPELQLSVAEKIVTKEVSAKAVRREGMKKAREEGQRLRYAGPRTYDLWESANSLVNVVQRTSADLAGKFEDQSFKSTVATRHPEQVARLVQTIGKVRRVLASCEEELRRLRPFTEKDMPRDD